MSVLDEITVTAGALLIAWSLWLFRASRLFIARCRTATGTVVAYTTEDSDEGVYYYAITRFTDAAGKEHDLAGSHGMQHPPEIGEVSSITYDPDMPANAWVTGSSGPWFIPWFVLVVGVAVVAAGVVLHNSAA